MNGKTMNWKISKKGLVGILFTLFILCSGIVYLTFAIKNIETIISDCKTFYYCLDDNFINRKTDEDFKTRIGHLKTGFHSFANNIFSNYTRYNPYKIYMINIYGLTVKFLDLYKPVPNDSIVKLTNNQLSFYECKDVDVDDYATALIDFKTYLEKNNTGFVYVQAPHKCYKYQPNLPPGITDYNIQIFDRLIQSVEDSVPVIDMREYFKSHPEKHYKLFYPGDAHWRPEYAFITSQQIMKHLQNNYSCIIDPVVNNLNNYKLVIADNKCNEISLRLGHLYFSSDMERQQYLVPRFDTFMSINSNSVKILNWDSIDYQGSYNPGLLFLARPDMKVRNIKALNNKRIMVLGDSFSPPVMSYLSLYFTDIEYHGLNCYDGNIFDDIEKFNPDIVILVLTARIVELFNPEKPIVPSTKRYFETLIPQVEKESRQELK